MKIIDNLVKYGLNKEESTVYVDVVKNSDSTAFAVHKRLGMPKTSVYHILDALKAKGLIEIWKKNNVSYYSAESPKRLLYNLEEKAEIARDLISELTNLRESRQTDSVFMYEGEEGLKKVMKDALEYCKLHRIKVMYTAAIPEFENRTPRFINSWVKEREGMGIFVRMLKPKSEKMHPGYMTNSLRETRQLPEGFDLPGIINLYGNRVDLFSMKNDKLNAVVIESETYTALLRNFFNLIWEGAKG